MCYWQNECLYDSTRYIKYYACCCFCRADATPTALDTFINKEMYSKRDYVVALEDSLVACSEWQVCGRTDMCKVGSSCCMVPSHKCPLSSALYIDGMLASAMHP